MFSLATNKKVKKLSANIEDEYMTARGLTAYSSAATKASHLFLKIRTEIAKINPIVAVSSKDWIKNTGKVLSPKTANILDRK